jgi:D-glycero-alpha-D-manno-heptose-7-phosphate kinase
MRISRTPLRFSLIGGGSDLRVYWQSYGPCKIISMTLSPSMYVTYMKRDTYDKAGQSYGKPIRISYTRTEHVDRLEDVEHDIIRESLLSLTDNHPREREKLCAQFEMTTIGSIPSRGSGLGSSSALTVGIMRLFLPDHNARTIARLAESVECDRLRRNIGCQDHLAAAWGGLRRYTVRADMGVLAERIGDGKWLADHLLAFKLPVSKTTHVENAPPDDVHVGILHNLKTRLPYLKETVELVPGMRWAIENYDVEEMASVLRNAWKLKKASHGFLDENVERLYNRGINSGALAGKLSGSMNKGAGHLFFLAYPDVHANIREKLTEELAEMKVEYYPHGSKVWEI